MSASQTGRDDVVAGALALQRVLALEGRNALARVELAASELDRFEVSPGIQDRITAIREAVGELDGLLEKIERLADPARPGPPSTSSRLDALLAPLLARIEPALAARGIAIVVDETLPSALVGIPGAVLERLVLLWLRLAVAAGEEVDDASDEEPDVLRLAGREEAGSVVLRLAAGTSARAPRPPIDRALQVELDVALAEWRALAQREDEGPTPGWTLLLPRSAGDA